MKIPRKRRNTRLIPRFDLQGFHVNNKATTDPITGIITEGVITLSPFKVEMCTLHPTTGADLQALPEGLRQNTVYTLITDSDLQESEQGTSYEGDIIKVPVNKARTKFKTFWVMRVANALNNVIPSTKAILVEYETDYNIGIDFKQNYAIDINGTVTSYSTDDEVWWDYWECV